MKCHVCGIEGPDKFSRLAEPWDWFTGWLSETVHFCMRHKNSPERERLWKLSQVKPPKDKPNTGIIEGTSC